MYKKGIYKIRSNECIARSVYRMVLEGDTSYITAPGQFVNIELESKFLRRPISVCDYDERTLTIIYKVLGEGTGIMAGMAAGGELDILTGLGNGFSIAAGSERPLLVGGGVGVPPLYNLAKRLTAEGKRVSVAIGCNSAADVFLADEFRQLGADVHISTVDGSQCVKGFVTDAIVQAGIDYDYVYACGPVPMLKAVADMAGTEGQLSFEERMGCGFGGCMGCTCRTKYGNKRICREGPVLTIEETVW